MANDRCSLGSVVGASVTYPTGDKQSRLNDRRPHTDLDSAPSYHGRRLSLVLFSVSDISSVSLVVY